MLQIRRYRPEDYDTVRALHEAGLKQMGFDEDQTHQIARFAADLEDIEGVYLSPRGDFLVGLVNGEIVAMGALRPKTDSCGEIKRIRVRQDCQRQGCARQMLQYLVELAPRLGYTELVLDTLSSNMGAQRLFESCGFTKSGREMQGIYDLMYYTKTL